MSSGRNRTLSTFFFFLFNQGIIATETAREFCVVSEEGDEPQINVHRRLLHFKNENFDLKYWPHFS